jgi:hypothetical protein
VVTLAEQFGTGTYQVFKIALTTESKGGAPAVTNTIFFGPILEDDLTRIIDEARKTRNGVTIEVVGKGHPVTFYSNAKGKIIAGFEDPAKEVRLERLGNAIQTSYYREPVEKVRRLLDQSTKDKTVLLPPVEKMEVARVTVVKS